MMAITVMDITVMDITMMTITPEYTPHPLYRLSALVEIGMMTGTVMAVGMVDAGMAMVTPSFVLALAYLVVLVELALVEVVAKPLFILWQEIQLTAHKADSKTGHQSLSSP